MAKVSGSALSWGWLPAQHHRGRFWDWSWLALCQWPRGSSGVHHSLCHNGQVQNPACCGLGRHELSRSQQRSQRQRQPTTPWGCMYMSTAIVSTSYNTLRFSNTQETLIYLSNFLRHWTCYGIQQGPEHFCVRIGWRRWASSAWRRDSFGDLAAAPGTYKEVTEKMPGFSQWCTAEEWET